MIWNSGQTLVCVSYNKKITPANMIVLFLISKCNIFSSLVEVIFKLSLINFVNLVWKQPQPITHTFWNKNYVNYLCVKNYGFERQQFSFEIKNKISMLTYRDWDIMGSVTTQTRGRAFQTFGRAFDFFLRLQKLCRVFERLGRVF